MQIIRAEKYGFCAGVRIADQKVRKFARLGEGDGRILGQVVHNERVVEQMAELGVPTVDSIEEVEAGTLVFSAHGVPPSFHQDAESRGLKVLDTTCPFVYDIHDEADRAQARGTHLAIIGQPDHREVIGYTLDRAADSYHVVNSLEEAAAVDWARYDSVKILYQTTLNADDFEDVAGYIEAHAPHASRADTICYATKENQDAARALCADPRVDLVLVVGGRNSANTRHLWEICKDLKPAHLVHEASEIDPTWFAGITRVGVTAGASTPDDMIDEVEAQIRCLVAEGDNERTGDR